MDELGNTHRVLPKSGNGWDVKRDGAERASAHFDTQKEAIDAGRIISRNQGTEFAIHGRDGKIRSKDSHGNDPFPPRG